MCEYVHMNKKQIRINKLVSELNEVVKDLGKEINEEAIELNLVDEMAQHDIRRAIKTLYIVLGGK